MAATILTNIPNIVQALSYTSAENSEPMRHKGDRTKDT